MNILIVSSEVYPFVPSSELANFAGLLPAALQKLGHDVRVITPKYKVTDEQTFALSPVIEDIGLSISNRVEKSAILEGRLEKTVPVYFLKNDAYYRRDHLYGDSQGDYPDNAERFIYFSRSIPEICKALDFAPDILHCNDWQTGLVPVYLEKFYHDDPFFANTHSVFTVHNLGYQGLFWHYDMHLTGLGWDLFTPDGLEYYGKINLMKGGLLWSDVLSTVSPTYSREIQTKECGHGLEGVLQFRREALHGVVNGVDYTHWNPTTDTHIAKTYSENNFTGKIACKRALLKEFALPVKVENPILATIAHLDDEKGIDILAESLDELLQRDLYLILMGTGHERYHKRFHRMKEKYPEKLGVRFDTDEALAHTIYAGADMLVIPSRYEPSGVHQLYGMKYGTIPIVRNVGNLNDTVLPLRGTSPENGTGFVFTEMDSQHLLQAIYEGLAVFQDKKVWKALRIRAMRQDFSWNFTANTYETLYHLAQEQRDA